jgi:hypothetical protein
VHHDLTPAEAGLLRRVDQISGRYTFRTDASSSIAYRLFEEGVLSVLRSLEKKGLVHLDPAWDRGSRWPGESGRFAAITVEITEAGREALR